MDKIKIITHNGGFHTDEVFSVAAIIYFLKKSAFPAWRSEKVQLLRTRDEDMIQAGDFVVDVGGVYDEENNRFDHHQIGGAGVRENNIPYSSFGLVWKKYGERIAGNIKIAEILDQTLVQSVDAVDNGVDVFKPIHEDIRPFFFQDAVSSFVPSWNEKDVDIDAVFLEVVTFAEKVLERMMKKVSDSIEAEHFVEKAYSNAVDKRIIILDGEYPAQHILSNYPEPMYVVKPRSDGSWQVKTIPEDNFSFKNRKDLPQEWAGKRDEELQNSTGVSDSLFCHTKRFMIVAESKEGAIELAQKAVNS